MTGTRGSLLGALVLAGLFAAGTGGPALAQSAADADETTAETSAETSGDTRSEDSERSHRAQRKLHWSSTLGWFTATTGPLSHGPAWEAELYPGGGLGRFGIGLYYRGDREMAPGTVLLGLAYEAAASRPRLVLGLHADIGFDVGNRLPVVGGGLRTLLAVSGPFVVSANLTGHLFYDGIDTRLGLASTFSVGLAN